MGDITERKAAADPTKEFFVNMITRDITLEDSIFDLIDNSIDAAWKAIGSPATSLMDDTDLSEYLISIELSPQKFSIKDNCGGMSLDDAVNHAFNFGRRESEENDDYSIGVYGIGMKRAVFKIGREIRIRSTVPDDDESTLAFAVPINVNDWLKSNNPPWDFDIVDDENLDKHGVEIVVEDLTIAARISFNNPEFIANLRRMIARDYMLYLNRGLNLTVCGQAITGIPINLAQSDDFVPLRYNYEDQQNGEVVSVEITLEEWPLRHLTTRSQTRNMMAIKGSGGMSHATDGSFSLPTNLRSRVGELQTGRSGTVSIPDSLA